MLYSRQGCHLCERMLDELAYLLRGRIEVAVCDIDADPDLHARYGLRVPVLQLDAEEICHGHLDAEALERLRVTLGWPHWDAPHGVT